MASYAVKSAAMVDVHLDFLSEAILDNNCKYPIVRHPMAMEILLALSRCVRALTAGQIADGFFAGNLGRATRTLSILQAQQLLVKNRLPIREIAAAHQPLATWRVGEQAPPFNAIVVAIRNRWQLAPTRVTTVYLAGPAAQRVTGYRAAGKLKRPLQASHDLGLSGVYLAVRRDRPQLAICWRGEDIITNSVGAVPDAICIDGSGNPQLAIEFCGLYSTSRLRSFHRHCAARRLSYELW